MRVARRQCDLVLDCGRRNPQIIIWHEEVATLEVIFDAPVGWVLLENMLIRVNPLTYRKCLLQCLPYFR